MFLKISSNEYSFMHFLCKKLHMRILVIADTNLKEELALLSGANGIDMHYIKEPGVLKDKKPFDACIDLLFEFNKERVKWLKGLNIPVIVVNAVNITLEEIGEDFIRINGWRTFLQRPVIEAATHSPFLKTKGDELFGLLGRKTEWLPDIAGFFTPRVISTIINEAYYTLEENVSSEQEIDTAMRLGTNYPFGPFDWAQKIGLQNIYSLLARLAGEEKQYQPSALLKQRALA